MLRTLVVPAAAWVSWRQEYVRAHAGWRAGPRHRAGAPLLHAALAPGGALLALAAADATLLLWAARGGAWAEAGRADLRARGWATVARSQWATAGRLLLTGSLSLVSDWELLVLHVDDDGGCGAVYSRVRCSAGAAGCWADPAGEAFLSFELHRLGAGIYCTTVWLNAATQARAGGAVGRAAVGGRACGRARGRARGRGGRARRLPARHRAARGGRGAGARAGGGRRVPAGRVAGARAAAAAAAGERGWRAGGARAAAARAPRRAGAGRAGAGRGGRARRLHAARAPGAPARAARRTRLARARAVYVGGEQRRQRDVRVRARAAAADARAGPRRRRRPPLRAARRRRRPRGVAGGRARGPRALGGGGGVRGRRAGARRGGRVLRAAARRPAAGAGRRRALRVAQPRDAAAGRARVLAASPLLVAAARQTASLTAFKWQHYLLSLGNEGAAITFGSAPSHTHDMALRVPLARVLRAAAGSCGAAPPPRCPPCRPAPPPPCRARPPAAPRARRVLCCAPPASRRPPCAPRLPACALTCDSQLPKLKTSSRTSSRDPFRITSTDCEVDQDPVAERLKLAKRAQRAEYEREVSERAARAPPAAPPRDLYRLSGERECARATDGCVYAVLPDAPAPPAASTRAAAPRRCGPGREPPPPRCVQLAHDDACRIKGDAHLDPCAHLPRVMVEIDRSSNHVATSKPATPKSSTGEGSRSAHPSWCADPPKPASPPPRCRRPTIVERLRSHRPESRTERRIHTSVSALVNQKSGNSNSSGWKEMLHKKKQLKVAGVGRVAVCTRAAGKQAPPPGGELQLRVPPGTTRVAVRVSLHAAPGAACPAPAPSPVLPTPSRTKQASSCTNFTSKPENSDSWLSIKSIQKKISAQCHQESGSRKVGRAAPDSPPAAPHAPRCAGSRGKAGAKHYSSAAALLANTISSYS
nr:uncharacterized protein LOC110383186 isoform X2 [Helicoverpa armigera]